MALPTSRSNALALAALSALVVVAHGLSLGSGFCWDDAFVVLGNEHVRSFDVARILEGGLWSGAGLRVRYWRPLPLLTMAAQLAVTGEAWFLHLGNLVLHLAVAVLVYLVSLRATGSRLGAFAAAALFGVHPVTVEVASGIANRGDALATGFVLLAVLSHAAGTTPARIAGTAAAVFAACACKETGIAALPALFAWDLGLRARGDPRALVGMLRGRLGAAWAAAGAATGAFLLVRHAVVGGVALAPDFLRNPLVVASGWDQEVLALATLGQGVRLLVWPDRLSVDYSFHALPTDVAAAAPLAILGGATAVAAAVVAVRSFRRGPAVAFGLVLAAAAWAPVSNLLLRVEVMFAERFLYLPIAGVCVAAAGAAAWLGARVPRGRLAGLAAAAAVILALLGARTIARTLDWRDQRTLVGAAVAASPDNARVQLAWAQLLVDERRWADADRAFERAVAIWPGFAAAWTERATALRNLGRVDEAIAAASRAVQLDPDDPISWYNLALEWALASRTDAALAVAREGLARHPTYAPLATLAARLGR